MVCPEVLEPRETVVLLAEMDKRYDHAYLEQCLMVCFTEFVIVKCYEQKVLHYAEIIDLREKMEGTASQDDPVTTEVQEPTDEMVAREAQEETELKETEDHLDCQDSLEIEELLVLLERRDELSTAKMETRVTSYLNYI